MKFNTIANRSACRRYLPIECALIDSYPKPGRNCTGVAANAGIEVLAKRLEFLRAMAPSARRLAFLSPDLSQFTVSGLPLDVWTPASEGAKALASNTRSTLRGDQRM